METMLFIHCLATTAGMWRCGVRYRHSRFSSSGLLLSPSISRLPSSRHCRRACAACHRRDWASFSTISRNIVDGNIVSGEPDAGVLAAADRLIELRSTSRWILSVTLASIASAAIVLGPVQSAPAPARALKGRKGRRVSACGSFIDRDSDNDRNIPVGSI